MKFNPLPEIVGGKALVVVDDSIVRGNTTRQIVQMLRDAGAREVHMRISAPPIKHPCHYGIDMSTREEMIAHGRSVEEIAAELGCDSLAYISLGGVYEAVGGSRAAHCDACFSGEYPLASGAATTSTRSSGLSARSRVESARTTASTAADLRPTTAALRSLARWTSARRSARHFGFAPSGPARRRRCGPRSTAAMRSS